MKPAKKVGLVFAVLHLIAFFLFVIYLNLSTDGQSRLLWTLWLTPDFPVSLFMMVGFDVISPDSQIGGFIRTWLPYLVHGVLGTIWWFFVPILIGSIFTKILGKSG